MLPLHLPPSRSFCRFSHNHYMFAGGFHQWLQQGLGGINPSPSSPSLLSSSSSFAYASVLLAPRPAPPLTFANASYRSVRGLIHCNWTLTPLQATQRPRAPSATPGAAGDYIFELHVLVPPNVNATVLLPPEAQGNRTFSLDGGGIFHVQARLQFSSPQPVSGSG